MEVDFFSSAALRSLSSPNFCPEAQCSHVQMLPKHAGWQPSVYTQDNPRPKFFFPVFRRCFHVVLNRLCLGARSNRVSLVLCLEGCWWPPTVDMRVWAMSWPECAAALAPCPAAKPAEDGDGCHSPLPSASLETIHWEAASHYHHWTAPGRVHPQWLIQWIWHAGKKSLEIPLFQRKHLDTLRKQI